MNAASLQHITHTFTGLTWGFPLFSYDILRQNLEPLRHYVPLRYVRPYVARF